MARPEPREGLEINTSQSDTFRPSYSEVSPELVERARDFFEASKVEAFDQATTVPGYFYQFNREKWDEPDKHNPLGYAIHYLRLVEYIIELEYALKFGAGDVLEDKAGAKVLLDETIKESRDLEKRRNELTELVKTAEREADPHEQEDDQEGVLHDELESLRTRLLSLDKKLTILGILSDKSVPLDHTTRDRYRGIPMSELAGSYKTVKYLDELSERGASRVRHDLVRQLKVIRSGEFDSLIPDDVSSEDRMYNKPFSGDIEDVRRVIEIDGAQELDFTILPGDTNLRELSEDIFSESSDVNKEKVDLGRVQVLEDMRQLFGKDRCYYARGQQQGRRYDTEDGGSISEDFIILVIQNHDEQGKVASEDALAISPISRRHAAFYMREVASAGTWRELFGVTKMQARGYGARRLKFTAPEDVDIYEAMRKKVSALSMCDPDDFQEKLRYDTKTKLYSVSSFEKNLTRAATRLVS